MATVETRYGALSVPDSETDVIGCFLARYGEWAWDEARFVARTLPENGASVLDVGAYVGTFGLGIAAQRRLGFVCFVEANSYVLPMLTDNAQRNCAAPFAVEGALLGWAGVLLGNGRCEPGNTGSMSYIPEVRSPDSALAGPSPSKAVTLEDLRARYGDFDLVKLDVEGMELGILRSDAEHLAHGKTSLWVECNENPLSLEVAELLLSWGLNLWYFAFPAHNRDNLVGDPTPIFSFAYEAGLLAAPRTAPALDDELLAHGCILRPVKTVEDVKQALWRTPRWGASEWVGAKPEEIAALAGHWLRGDDYRAYLSPGWRPGDLLGQGLRTRVAALEEGLRRAEALAIERLALLETENERAEAAETLLALASAQALDRLAELGLERERTAAAQARIAELEARVSDAESRAAAIERSTLWRLVGPMRRFVAERPRLRSILRRGTVALTGLRSRT